MKHVSIIVIIGCLFAAHVHGAEPTALATIIEESEDSGHLVEYLAAQADIKMSEAWKPDSNSGTSLPLKSIIDAALKFVPKPESKYVYTPAALRGVNLRNFYPDGNLWYWEVFFAYNLDRAVANQALIRDGEVILSTRVLPNGGRIYARRRAMTAKERVSYGLDTPSSAESKAK